MSAWTREAVEALGPTINVPTVAAILGVNPETVYAAIRRGEWTTTRVLRLGRVIKLPTLDVVRLLYAPEAGVAAPIPAVPSPCQHVESVQLKGTEPQSQCGCRVTLVGAVRPLREVT
ncbi:DNA-binding protein [Streptomyces sp. NPDC008079]|uniref:DNA-binding protein n=1 Tax=Streptomyces sp. NPDC008079 TaxID=3364806 RepID=UPI0036E41761